MGNTNSKLNSRKVEPTMTIAGNYEIPAKKVFKPISCNTRTTHHHGVHDYDPCQPNLEFVR